MSQVDDNEADIQISPDNKRRKTKEEDVELSTKSADETRDGIRDGTRESVRDNPEDTSEEGEYLRPGPHRTPRGYEYCDHTADVQIHSWGKTLGAAFEECCTGMFGYMTDITTVHAQDTFALSAEGHDIESLLFNFLDEWLYAFSVEPYFIANEINILEFDEDNYRIRCEGYGEPFNLDKHPQGTEVKAITYSAMQVHRHEWGVDLFVIVDI